VPEDLRSCEELHRFTSDTLPGASLSMSWNNSFTGQGSETALFIRSTCEKDGLSAHDRTAPRSVVALGLDEGYAWPGAVVLASLGTTGGMGRGTGTVYVCFEKLSRDSVRVLQRVAAGVEVNLSFIETRVPRGLPASDHLSRATYLRLAIPDALPAEPSLLYLDADVLAVSDIRPLLDLDLKGFPVGAVRDLYNPLLRLGQGLPGYHELGIRGDREYFNGGVMKIDVSMFREMQIAERAKEFLLRFPQHVRFCDQCALNWAVADHWVRLPLTWNALTISVMEDPRQYTCEEVLPLGHALAVERSAAILHFAGSWKPWLPGFREGEALSRYRQYSQVVEALLRRPGRRQGSPRASPGPRSA
jgi:lipopolysaccharide biosynthesis glycosyltransferase